MSAGRPDLRAKRKLIALLPPWWPECLEPDAEDIDDIQHCLEGNPILTILVFAKLLLG